MFSHYLRHMLLIERVKLLSSTLQTVLFRLLKKVWASLVSPKSKHHQQANSYKALTRSDSTIHHTRPGCITSRTNNSRSEGFRRGKPPLLDLSSEYQQRPGGFPRPAPSSPGEAAAKATTACARPPAAAFPRSAGHMCERISFRLSQGCNVTG